MDELAATDTGTTHEGHASTTATAATAPHDHGGHDKHEGHSPEMFRDRLWVSLILTVPILYFSEQIQEWFGYEAVTFPGNEWVSPILSTVLFVYAGGVFLRGGLRELRAREPGMMTLISIAISVAYFYSMAVSLGLDGDPFYWELATLLDVMLLGHWMEMRSIQSASRALEHLAAMVPSIAHRVEADGTVADVEVASLLAGDQILIRPGEQVPADGDVLEGTSSMNEAFLTGESRPVRRTLGDEVIAGAVNGEGALTLQVTRTGDATTLSQIMRLVEEAQQSRSRFQALADRAAYWLTVIAIGVAVPTFIGWAAFGGEGITFAVARAVTVLVIACPHALGLAIPLVNMNATGVAARNGILVRNREAFERGRNISFVAFDKTGTLTEGRFVVTDITTNGTPDEQVLAIGAGIEKASEHPLAAAIVTSAQERGIEPAQAGSIAAIPGNGIEGIVDTNTVRVGRPEWAAELGLTIGDELAAALARADDRGESAIAVMTDREVVGVIALADKVRDSARATVQELKSRGVTPVMITGDAHAVAGTVAADLGIDRYYARVLPQDKARIVNELKTEGPTAFVGDGINDAPALLAADIGIAIGAGTNVAIESADLVLVEDDPADVVRTLMLSDATRRKMVQNLGWATGYNTVAIPLAAGVGVAFGVLLQPAVGALFMSLSTVIVAVNALLLKRVDLSMSRN
ncbi:MAG TPA: heavy metal translocating P-type ATPase [Acidimicrobiia bacterium]|nr:heavy metal translocating P-type ATPase [Acidimicrobiia bacterium]